jgi:hypothetical protein
VTNVHAVAFAAQLDVGEDEVDLFLLDHPRRIGEIVHCRHDVVARLAQHMLVVERHQRLVLDDHDAPDCPFTLTKQHLERPASPLIDVAA